MIKVNLIWIMTSKVQSTFFKNISIFDIYLVIIIISKHEIPRTIAERIIIYPSTIENVNFCQIDCSIQKRRFIDV